MNSIVLDSAVNAGYVHVCVCVFTGAGGGAVSIDTCNGNGGLGGKCSLTCALFATPNKSTSV